MPPTNGVSVNIANRTGGPKTSRGETLPTTIISRLRSKSHRPVAVFLGAGASKTFGYPLTRDLMLLILKDLSRHVSRKKARASGKEDLRAELYRFLCELLPGERSTEERVPMVTGVLSLIDFSLSTGQVLLPGWSLEQTRRVRQSLEHALLEAIPDYEWFEEEEEQRYGKFRKWVSSLKARRPPGGVGLITTNYDMVSDLVAMEVANVEGGFQNWSLPDLARKVDYGFRWVRGDRDREEWFPRPANPVIGLYKLHGSTNWLRCPLCENVYVNPMGPTGLLSADKLKTWANVCHCSETQLSNQIVSPSFIRELREPNLIAVWKTALDFLRESDIWVIIGYSFPDEDVALRALFTRAIGSKGKMPHVVVVQRSDAVRVNYESFFPEGVMTFYNKGLEAFLAACNGH